MAFECLESNVKIVFPKKFQWLLGGAVGGIHEDNHGVLFRNYGWTQLVLPSLGITVEPADFVDSTNYAVT